MAKLKSGTRIYGNATVDNTLTAQVLSTGASGTGINITTNNITGPSTITIDPSTIGDDTGTVEIKGNLTVQGTTTTINSTTSVIFDPVIELRRGNSLTASDGGIQVNLTTNAGGTVTGFQRIQWNNANSRWETTNGTTAKEIVNTVDAQTIAGNKTFSNNLTASGTNATIQFSPTGTGTVTINPATAGSIDRMNIGATTAGTGRFTTLEDSSGNVRSVPQNARTSAYTLVAADAGDHISITTGGVTVPAGVFSIGDVVTIYNNSANSQTITQGASVTLRLAGSSATGNRTLVQYGLCSIMCVASNVFVISGAGLT